jgi:glycosyltransferase involved in cell wall biosynthesis
MKRIVIDGLPLQVRSAGIAAYTAGLVRTMPGLLPDAEFVLFGLNRAGLTMLRAEPRAHRLDAEWPPNVRHVRSLLFPVVMGYPVPAVPRLLTLESAVGASDMFHGTNYALPRARSACLVVTVHDLALLRYPHLGTAALSRFIRQMTRSVTEAKRVIAVSDATRRDIIDLLGTPAEKIRVIHNGYDQRFRPLPHTEARARVGERYGLSEPYILHVGTLEPRKNLETLISAYARLRRERYIPHGLVLVGDRGWKYDPIFQLVDQLGLRNAVRFTGAVPADDLPALYNAADLFVYPSLYEGFGLPPLEAMACGTPVVTSNVSSLPEVVGDAALLVDPHDEGALAEAMARVLSDVELRRHMRERGLERARHFSWERCARETLAVYEEVMGA